MLWADLSAFPKWWSRRWPRRNRAKRRSWRKRVFTIGSPSNQQKILEAGIVSKVEPHAILSDIEINHGNSGGPLFSSLGLVVGLTTFADLDSTGTGVSASCASKRPHCFWSARKERCAMSRAAGRAAAGGTVPDVSDRCSESALLEDEFDERPYYSAQGDYDVAIIRSS